MFQDNSVDVIMIFATERSNKISTGFYLELRDACMSVPSRIEYPQFCSMEELTRPAKPIVLYSFIADGLPISYWKKRNKRIGYDLVLTVRHGNTCSFNTPVNTESNLKQ